MKVQHKLLYAFLALQLTGLIAVYVWYLLGLGFPSVLLKTQPVDPFDYLRGQYIILRYEMSVIPAEQFPQKVDGQDFYAILKMNEGYAALDYFTDQPPTDQKLYLKGKLHRGVVEYDLEKYFVPKGMGNPVQPLTVQVSIRPGGRGLIKQLYSNGSPWPPQ